METNEVETVELLLKQLESKRSYHPSGAKGLHAYASEAGDCTRKIGLRLLKAPAGNTWTDAGKVNVAIGNFLHDTLQDALSEYLRHTIQKPYGTSWQDLIQFETSWFTDRLSGRCDGKYLHPDYWDGTEDSIERSKVILEIKSQNPNAYGSALSSGPNRNHVLQGSLSALHFDVPYVHMVYIPKLPAANQPALAEWVLPVDVEAATAERERLQQTVELAESGTIPACEYEGRYISPEQVGSRWPCGYCPFFSTCAQLGAGAQPVEALQDVIV